MDEPIINVKEFVGGCLFFSIVFGSCIISICGIVYIVEKLSVLCCGDWF